MPLISKAFSDLITFSRTGGTATYFAANGVLTTAGADVPRFDYDPATFLPRGLLIEESRTNLLLQSAAFNTTWSANNITITADTTASPDGGTNGDGMLATVAGGYVSQTSQSFAAGSTITFSVFAKKNASNFLRVELGNLVSCWFNLNTGATASNNAGSGNVLFSSKSIQAISNGWYRCVLTVTTSTITTLLSSIYATDSDGNSSSINSSIFLWGAQLEAGAFPTSYIPTTTTSLTRNADTANINTMSPWYNQVNGSVYAEFISITDGSATQTNASQGVWSTTQSALGSFNGYGTEVNLTTNTAVKLVGRARYVPTGKNNVISIGSATGYIAANTTYKTAFAWDASNIVGDSNIGALNSIANTAAVDMGVHNRMTLGNQNVGGGAPYQLNGWLRKITFYPTKLSDANLGILTT